MEFIYLFFYLLEYGQHVSIHHTPYSRNRVTIICLRLISHLFKVCQIYSLKYVVHFQRYD